MDRYVPLPPLPARISRLNELAYDLWWSWTPQAREVFRDLDYPLWRFTDHNPVLLLHLVEADRLEHAAGDPEFLRRYDQAVAGLDIVGAGAGTWWSRQMVDAVPPIAWVTPEFALHQSLPVDTSAAGVVAGDFCKEASDLGVPLVGVGLMYPRGYAHQRISPEGSSQERYEYIDWSDAPIGPAVCPDGSRCTFSLTLGGDPVTVAAWRIRAGRVTVYLLDTDLLQNAAWDRELSSGSFGDDSDARARQAALLGAGAVRVLEALHIEPSVWHLAEAPAAFVSLERLNQMVRAGSTVDAALERVRATTLFCTRDAAPARRDGLNFSAVDRRLAALWPALADQREAVLALGRHDSDRGASFNAAVLGARTTGTMTVPETAAGNDPRLTWQHVRGETHGGQVRVVSDGVHLPSWVSGELSDLFDAHIGPDWRERQDDELAWQAIRVVPDAELWTVRQRMRGYLIDFMRERARRRWARERASGARMVALGTLLDASVLTIGFARRFTDAARPDLLFHDAERLAAIVTAARRPIQVVFAGKAHPGDESGKHHLQRMFRHALDPALGGRIAFVENYDLHVARLLVQGCDVWLSTPRRGGTPSLSALKAAVNGVPHLGTPDAWWAAGATGRNGWMIDASPSADASAQDAADARDLYRRLEEQIVPAFYERDRAAIPTAWIVMVKDAIATALPRFCARRTVKTFAEMMYLPTVRELRGRSELPASRS
jgi:starch phosphorylase